MLKAHTYKTKQSYENNTKKANTMKMELIISSNHEVSEHTLGNINEAFKKMLVVDYIIKDEEKPKVKSNK